MCAHWERYLDRKNVYAYPHLLAYERLKVRKMRHDEQVRGVVGAGDDDGGSPLQLGGLLGAEAKSAERAGDGIVKAARGLGQAHAVAGAFHQAPRELRIDQAHATADQVTPNSYFLGGLDLWGR